MKRKPRPPARRPAAGDDPAPRALSVPAAERQRAKAWIPYWVIVVAGCVAYGNSFAVPFVFDGVGFIVMPTANQLWPPIGLWQSGARGVGVYSFALDRAWCGGALWGYHATNLAIHIAAGLLLYSIAAQTFAHPQLPQRYRCHAHGLALAVALLWTVHPLQTECVTNLYQRFESLMGMFFLASVWCFLRAQRSPRPVAWYAALVLTWLLALGTKEVAAVLPCVLLWYDRVFVAASWRDVLRRRWPLYAFFALVLGCGVAYLVAQRASYQAGGVLVAGKIPPWRYALAQPGVILHYLRLALWPSGQCLDYWWEVPHTAATIVPPLVVILALAGMTVWCVFRYPPLGFLGGWFFLILAPTSSFLPIIDLACEHRMYLPLAAVAAAVVVGCCEGWQRLAARRRLAPRRPAGLAWGALALAGLGLGCATFQRNGVYADDVALWRDVVEKRERNPRAHSYLSSAYAERKQYQQAAEQAQQSLALNPEQPLVLNKLAVSLGKLRRATEAAAAFHAALNMDPLISDTHLNFGLFLSAQDPQSAEEHFRRAVELDPRSVKAHNNLGFMLAGRGQLDEAIAQYQEALRLDPQFALARKNLRAALERRGASLPAATSAAKR